MECEKLSDDRLDESSSAIRERVEAARERQARRFAGTPFLTNADTRAPALRFGASAGVAPAEVRVYCGLDDTGPGAHWALLKAAMQ